MHMSTSSPPIKVFSTHKRYQCRYFDISGQPLNPPCNQGENCRFLHPNDYNWPGIKSHEKRMNKTFPCSPNDFDSRRKNINTEASAWDNSKRPDPRGPKLHLERHSIPLVPQSDLFLRRNFEGKDIKHEGRSHSRRRTISGRDEARDHGREHKHGRESRSRNRSPSSSRRYDTHKRLDRRSSSRTPRPTSRFSDMNHGSTSNDFQTPIQCKGSLVAAEKDSEYLHVCDQAPGSKSYLPQDVVDYQARTTQMVEIFRQLAKLFNQVTQETDVQTREEKDVEIYTELSSTLSKISAVGTASIIPNLADMILKIEERKKRVDDHFKSIAGLWQQAFEIFGVEVSRVMNDELGRAVKAIYRAADASSSSGVKPVETWKRPRPEASCSPSSVGDYSSSRKDLSAKEKEFKLNQSEHTTQQEHKRRRYDAPSPYPNETRFTHQYAAIEAPQSVQEILSQMKQKIDEQTQSLQKLMRENYELKALQEGQMRDTSVQISSFSLNSMEKKTNHKFSQGDMVATQSTGKLQSRQVSKVKDDKKEANGTPGPFNFTSASFSSQSFK